MPEPQQATQSSQTAEALQVVGAAIVRHPRHAAQANSFEVAQSQNLDFAESEVLCAKRPPGGNIGGRWEFVGGKVEPGETPIAALIRECQEEIGATIVPKYVLAQTTMVYPRGPITLTTYYCELVEGEPVASEHEEIRWVSVGNLHELNWAPLDLEAVKALQHQDAAVASQV